MSGDGKFVRGQTKQLDGLLEVVGPWDFFPAFVKVYILL
jgi:hypothetical protein